MVYLDKIVDRERFTTPAKWERLEAAGLPASIHYDFDGISWFKANKLPLPNGWSDTPIDGPRLWTTYETQGRTNVSKTVFPAAFTLTSYEPLYEFHHGKKLAVSRTSGTTDSVTTKSSGNLLDPTFTGRALVVDGRSGREVTYWIRNSIVPGLTD